MSSLDKLLTFVAAALNALLAADPLHKLPIWVQVVAAVLIAGFAAIGIYTSAPVGRTRAGPPRV